MQVFSDYFEQFYQAIESTQIKDLVESIPNALNQRFQSYTHGLLDEWLPVLQQLPPINARKLELKSAVSVGDAQSLSTSEQEQLTVLLKKFHPWRKGPFNIHGIDIDTEWRSDWKWDRIVKHISPLKDRYVLDIGCGSGYHCWRMVGEQAKCVVGIDPYQLFFIQFLAIEHFLGKHPVYYLPLGIEYLPENLNQFDTVFSMGVFYHRKSPFEHLAQCKSLLRDGGELVLETLVIDGDINSVLIPENRYACMRNVWFIPSCLALEHWVKRAGFKNVRIVDVNQTSIDEQRRTEWMQFQSLVDFLNKDNPKLTIEGYPAPMRATLIANR